MPSPRSDSIPPKIFISYRRAEGAPYARLLADQLKARFGPHNIFIDIENIGAGRDFVKAIEEAVSSCQMLLAVIGQGWVTGTDEQGRRRLDDPEDFVRLEIAAALRRDIRVIPVLVQGATMPRRKDLPGDLASLTRRQSSEVTDRRWDDDVRKLIEEIEGDEELKGGIGRPKRGLLVASSAGIVLLALIALTYALFKPLPGDGVQPTPTPAATASQTPASSSSPPPAATATPSPTADETQPRPAVTAAPTPKPTPRRKPRPRSNCNAEDELLNRPC